MSAPGRSQALMPEPFGGEGTPVSATKLTILVVDDDADARLVMRAALRKAGYEVRTAEGATTPCASSAAQPATS
jgi:PleD family two-component response regulator